MDHRLLKELLEKAKSTKILDLQPKKLNSENMLDRENIVTIAEAIPSIEGLVAIDFSGCAMLPEFIQMLNEAIRNCKSLLYLGMHSVKLDDKGAVELINIVTEHPSIISLDISFNKLIRLPGKSISRLLTENFRLLSLDLSGNNLGMEDAEILRGIGKNTTILYFNVSPAGLFHDTVDEINEKVEENLQSFEEKVIEKNTTNITSSIPVELVNYLDGLIPKSVKRPVKMYISPVVFIGQWQADQKNKLMSVENLPFNSLLAYSMKKDIKSELVEEEQTPFKDLVKAGTNNFIK